MTAARCFLLLLPWICSCGMMAEVQSHSWNPIGWPGQSLVWIGRPAADSGLPLLREAGRLVAAGGEFIEAPAILLEGAFTADATLARAGAERIVAGPGGIATATINLPFFALTGSNVDLGREAGAVNDALRALEELEIEDWRYWPGDPREHVFPIGTRVRASGCNLIWVLPGGVEVLQAGEASPLFWCAQRLTGGAFAAQERSWGFVVGRRADWEAYSERTRVVTLIHEFYHQEMQLRLWFRNWTTLYWPAYGITFALRGWNDHWAEVRGPHAAAVVERGLSKWRPPARDSSSVE